MDPITLRAIERILVVLFGGLAIVLGYRLFLHVPERVEGAGKITLPGGVSIFLTRLGPGAFFALFGATVIALSFRFTLSQSTEARVSTLASTGDSVPVSSYRNETTYFSQSSDLGEETLAMERAQLRGHLFLLNRLDDLLRSDLAPEQRADLESAIPRIKLAAMRSVWSDEWGDFARFRQWVEQEGASGPPPDGLAQAAAFFRHGD